jgi:micrococcal nuclease
MDKIKIDKKYTPGIKVAIFLLLALVYILNSLVNNSSLDLSKVNFNSVDELVGQFLGIGTEEKIAGVQTDLAAVVRVVDGDTIVVKMNDKEETVRFIGINTPESVDPRKPVECFGKEASARMKELLKDGKVRLESDPSQAGADRYGRILRYVYLPDGTDINLKMIQDGYAFEYTYDIPYEKQTEFKKAQQEAMEAKRGLWAKDTCNGER